MTVTRHPNAGSFLERAGELLYAHEDTNGILLGMALMLRDQPAPDPEQTLFLDISEDGSDVNMVVLRLERTNAIIFGRPESWRNVAGEVIPAIRRHYPGLEGLQGPREQVLGLLEASGMGYRVEFEQGYYRLDAVTEPGACPGRARLPHPDEAPLLAEWYQRFLLDAGNEAMPLEQARKKVDGLLAGQSLRIWDDGGAASMAGVTRPTPNGICVAYVYTPPERRGKGYASNITAALSREMLDSGRQFCTLFTDMANPTSNKIYIAIGYRKVADFISVKFAP